MSTTLYIYTQQKLTLNEALAAFAHILQQQQSAAAILYSPQSCQLAQWVQGAVYDENGQPLDILTVFEARVFNELAELRWLNDPSPQQCHQAVVLTEQQSQLDWPTERRDGIIAKLPQRYLLWGEGTGRSASNGWSELATARIGALKVPIGGVGKNQRVLLHSVEYIVEAEHGNAVVFDERLTKLEVDHG